MTYGGRERRKHEREPSKMTNEDLKGYMDRIEQAMSTRPRRFGGFQIQEWVLFITFVFGAGLNYAAFVDLKDATKWLTEYAQRSDMYHGAVLGQQFYQGAPLNPNYDTHTIRQKLGSPVAETR